MADGIPTGTNVTTNSSGMQISKLLYRLCPLRCTAGVLRKGEARFSAGTTPTTWRFTGQREDATIGLYYFNARYLDPQLGRFTQPDTIVPEPGNPQALNRYSYVNNRPTVLIDPTGHVAHPNCQGSGAAIADCGVDDWYGYEDYAIRKQLRELGQREGDKVARALLDVVSALFEPADYIATIGACLSGDCSLLALGAMALPVVPGAVGRNADEAAGFVRSLDKDLYAFGNRTGPRPPRVGNDIIPDADNMLPAQAPPLPSGASTFSDPSQASLNGHYHRLPAGTELPSGLDVLADGLDVNPRSRHPATHHTIFNTVEMSIDRFTDLFRNLPWEYGGRQ